MKVVGTFQYLKKKTFSIEVYDSFVTLQFVNFSSICFLFFKCLIDIIVYLVPGYSGVSTEKDIGSLLEMFSDVAGSHDDSDGRRTSHDWDRTS